MKPQKILTEKQASRKKVGTFYHPTEKTYRTGACPDGYELRKSYHRKAYNKKNGIHVKESNVGSICIKNKGRPGKIIEKFKLPPLGKKDDLKPYGYNTRLTSNERFKCLLKAAKVLTYKTVVLRLSLLRTLTKRSSTKHSIIYNEDIKNLQAWRLKNPDIYKKKQIIPKLN